jgi:glycerophosphoryl diester phosphodiesterase
MQTKYTYKDKTYTHIYPLSEALGQEGIFIPLSISEEALAELDVTVTHEEEPLEVIKQRKITELKYQRDKAEVEPIIYQGYSFDYDDKARDRISAAIVALEVLGASVTLIWTTADNKDVKVTASDLRGIIAQVALRSDKLHTAYRKAKEKVETAITKAEVENVVLEV